MQRTEQPKLRLRQRAAAALFLLTLPAVLLAPSLFGGRTYLPYDLAAFPPASLHLDDSELAAVRDGENRDITEVPVWLMQGRHGPMSPLHLVEDYFAKLEAPAGKHLVVFENSGHNPRIQERERFFEILLGGVSGVAPPA